MLGDTVQDFSIWMDLDVSRPITRALAPWGGNAGHVPQHARQLIASVHLDSVCSEHGDKRMVRGAGKLNPVRSVALW